MPADDDPHRITSLEQLAALFGEVGEASAKKEVDHVHPHYRAMIEASPFAILATVGPEGLDASPRGDPPGFVVVEDDKTLLLPERRGNNRVDSLRNIVQDPRVALIFLIPGIGETLRVHGRAAISTEPSLIDRFVMQGQRPKCVLRISVDTVFFQCARAIHRSRLWKPDAIRSRDSLPSTGTMLSALTDAAIDGEAYDRELPARQASTLY
ncbi:pyridoxamine 5'-phosphate oxidase family protein [Piscinibacter terrae]|uniref:Pyridoxamine 5'-phosphate oxidase family protein n=1 Tax=Piscinibacter terrae TaxID=2496871 RepID=A0A3N7HXT1_9BURK|nr:pyridoxamine 5'-phosphate oxidase family protein [Albitalea terrae]RQP25871.1 pyridoxamine 5'-phosphate oxidase family protein [Albitalea terrae]